MLADLGDGVRYRVSLGQLTGAHGGYLGPCQARRIRHKKLPENPVYPVIAGGGEAGASGE